MAGAFRNHRRGFGANRDVVGKAFFDSFAGKLALAAAGGWLAAKSFRQIARRLSPRLSFRDKVVLITGGSRGLGLEIARRFAAEGAHVAICARDVMEVRRAEGELASGGGEVLGEMCDITRDSE